jgi:hypothetical protein
LDGPLGASRVVRWIVLDPLPSYVWYQDMVDFADGLRDRDTGQRLSRSLNGKGAFRRFRSELCRRVAVTFATR